jgi:F-type H+-transporting ATPase subunit g
LQQFQTELQPLIKLLQNPKQLANTVSSSPLLQPSNLLSTVKNADTATVTKYAVVAAEVIGFFSVGEIIGRMKLVGYRSSRHGHGSH